MKHMKTVQIPACEELVIDKVTCDLCGSEVDARGYNVDEVEILHRTGKDYPGDSGGEETSVDMCGKCFDEKLVPWLKSQGAEPRKESWYR